MEIPSLALVDPAVSRAKFDQQIAEYKQHEDDYIRRGWWMVRADFPEVFVVFGTPNLAPPAVAFGAVIDFKNYDLWPPSVHIVNPFTRERYRQGECLLPCLMLRRQRDQIVPLLQAHLPPNDHFFICAPGIREYHHHPAHTGDSWLLHRDRGEGTLYSILDLLFTYGVSSIKGYTASLQVVTNGFQGPTDGGQIPE